VATAGPRAGPRSVALDTADPTEDSRTMGSLSSAGLFRLGAAVLGMAGVGALVQAWATRRDERRYPPPGVLVDVGGNRLHLDVRGGGPGPTVVLEAGMGSFSPNWYWVQSELAPALRVVAYDRAGLGWLWGGGPRGREQLRVQQQNLRCDACGDRSPWRRRNRHRRRLGVSGRTWSRRGRSCHGLVQADRRSGGSPRDQPARAREPATATAV